MSKTSWLIALASVVLAFVGLLWLANMLVPYEPPPGEGARPDNIRPDSYPWARGSAPPW